MHQVHFKDIHSQGKVIKQDDRYIVSDVDHLNSMTLSLTSLNPKKATSGHAHPGLEEVYIFTSGEGDMELRAPDSEEIESFSVKAGDCVLVPAGYWHKVINDYEEVLNFFAIFQKYDRNDASATQN